MPLLLLRFLPYIIAIVAVLGIVYGIHHHGYNQGEQYVQAKWDKAKAEQVAAQLKKNAEDLAALRKLEENKNANIAEIDSLRITLAKSKRLRIPTTCDDAGKTSADNSAGAGELPTQSELDLAEARRELDEEAYRADRTVEDCRVLNEFVKN